MPACLLDGLRGYFPDEYLAPWDLNALDARIASHLGDYDRQNFVEFVARRRQKGAIRAGLLFAEKGLADEYCRKVQELAPRPEPGRAGEDAAAERQMQRFREILADPHADELDRQLAREILAAYEQPGGAAC